MRHEDCNNWDYETHPNADTVGDACESILNDVKAARADHCGCLSDSRPFHKLMFEKATPVACPVVAGNYRGADFDCLRNATVGFGGILGMPPAAVAYAVELLHTDLGVAVAGLDALAAQGGDRKRKTVLLTKIVPIAASVLVRFLTIHPYMNGNGHTGRLLVWILLSRFGFIPAKWTVDHSPPNYAALLDLHRSGDRKPLEVFIYRCVIG